MYSLSSEHIDVVNELVLIKQRKVHEAVVIPMIDYVPKILKKYDSELPKTQMNKFKERVKELGKMVKLSQMEPIVSKKGNSRVTIV